MKIKEIMDKVEILWKAIPKAKRGYYVGELNDIFLFLEKLK